MKQHEGVCPCTSVIKEKTPKKKIALNQVGVLARHKLWQFFFRRTVSTTDIVLPCCYEKALQFSGEIWAAKVHACSENLLAHLSVVSRVEVKKIAEIRASSLSCLAASRFCACTYAALLCSIVSLLAGYTWGYKSKILVSLKVFMATHHYFQL